MSARPVHVPKALFRSAHFERAAVDEAARTVPLTFSSEAPVERFFGIEILDHSPGAVSLDRLNTAGPLLFNHDCDEHLGRVESAGLDPVAKVCRATVRFSKSPLGEEKFRDVLDGILTEVSVGYQILALTRERVEAGVETYRATSWEPYEISLVTMPADVSVGVGRAAEKSADTITLTPRDRSVASTSTSVTMPDISAPTGAAPAVTQVNDLAAERQRVKSILAAARQLGTRHTSHLDAINTLARECAESGATVEAFQSRVLNEALATSPATPDTVRQISPELGLSKKEQRNYSILKALREVTAKRPLTGLELEASNAEAARLGRDASGFFVPAEVFAFARSHNAQRALSAGSASAGGYLIAESVDTANLVALLRNQSHVINLGARVLGGLVGNVSIPKHVTGATVYWVAENGTVTDSSASFGQLQLKPRRMGATTQLGKQLIAQSSLDVEMFARDDINAAMGIELDRVAINGAGGAEPVGILNLATADRSTSVTFGAAPTWAKVVSFETNVETANALGLAGGEYAYLTSPGVRGAWKTTSKVANTAAFLWENGDIVNGYAARSTNQVPSNKVIFGQFGQVIIGEWAGTDIVVDDVTLATSHQIKVTIQKLVDVMIRQGKAFAVSTDAGNQ